MMTYNEFAGYREQIESLRQKLDTANTAYEVVQKDCWNLTQKVIPNLRQQLTAREAQIVMLRDIMSRVADRIDAHQPFSAQALREALAATGQK